MTNPEQQACTVPGCEYKTPSECSTYSARGMEMRNHIDLEHNLRNRENDSRRVETKLDRPSIKAQATDVEWQVFESKWNRYKEASKLS